VLDLFSFLGWCERWQWYCIQLYSHLSFWGAT